MKRFFFIIISIVAVAAVVIGGIVAVNRRKAPPPTETTAVEPEPLLPPAPSSAPQPFAGKTASDIALAQRARSVAERYGSYSTDHPYENLRDLAPIVSDRLWSQFEAQMKKSGATQERVAVVSVGVETLEENEASRSFLVPVQRTVFSGGGSKQTERKMRITFVQEGGAWKADAIQWE